MATDTTLTMDEAAPVATTGASPQPKLPTEQWPSAVTTWQRYCYIGRWNYAKGIALAVAVGLVGVPFLGWKFLAIALVSAIAYVCISCCGLYLLYGPPSRRVFQRLLQMAGCVTRQDVGEWRVLDIHFGTYRTSRELLELLPNATVDALGVHDPEHESEPAVLDVWKFERPPVSHSRFAKIPGRADSFEASDHEYDLVVLGFGIHELHTEQERSELIREIHRVLAPTGKLLLFERGWSPLLALVFGPLFLHFTPAKVWDEWLRKHFRRVSRSCQFGMVDLFVAEQPNV